MPIRSFNEIEEAIYDKRGSALAYMTDAGFIFGIDGRTIAYVQHSRIWTYPGIQVGWFDRGWLRTLLGGCVGFAANADKMAGPQQPSRKHASQLLQKRALRAIGVRKPATHRPSFPKKWCKAPLRLFLAWVQYDAGQ